MKMKENNGHRLLLIMLMGLVGVMMTALSIARYRGYNTAMEDLGNMAQAIWSGTQGQPLLFTYFCHPVSRLGLHAELLYFLIVPLYALIPSPITLLTLQAVLFVAGAWPLFHLAHRRLKSYPAALSITLIYLLYPLAQNAVLFDFHADTLAMPLFFFALEALERGKERRYFFWIALALVSKVYVAYAVMLLGGLLFLRGKRRIGILTVGIALLWGAAAFFFVRPWFAAHYGLPVQSYDNYAAYYFGQTLALLGETWMERLLMGMLILLPLFPAVREAPWEVLAVAASIAPVLLSSGPGPRYSYKYHHFALSVPFVVLAILAAAERMRQTERRIGPWPAWTLFLTTALIIIVGLNMELSDTPLSPSFWVKEPGHGLDAWKYGRTERDAVKDDFVTQIPDGATLFATNFLAPHVVNRQTLCTMLPAAPPPPSDYEERLMTVDYALFDGLFDYNVSQPVTGLVTIPHSYLARYLTRSEWSVIAADDGLLLLKREASPSESLLQTITHTLASPPTETVADFGQGVTLIQAEITPLQGRRFTWHITWFNREPGDHRPRLLIISRLVGAEETRILHLPTTDLYPSTAWQAGEWIDERFEVQLPDRLPPGRYEVRLGLYRMDDPYAYATDARSRVGQEFTIAYIEVP